MDKTPSPSTSPQASEITVAVVEDDSSIRETLVAWLQKAEGIRCEQAFPDAESAIIRLPRLKPNIALVDINLPGKNGVECVKMLKPLLPDTQFVMLTVYADSSHIFDALSVGATGYLLKHTPREGLITALREVHAGGSPMSSIIARKVVQALQPNINPAAPLSERGNPTLRLPVSGKLMAVQGMDHRLSTRENEVLSLLAQGYLYKEIAEKMSIGVTTVNSYTRRIYEKLHVQSRSQAVAVCANLGDKKR